MPFLFLARVIALVATCLVYAPCAVGELNSEKILHPMLLMVEKDNGRTVAIRLGESVRVNLPENATTGYRWAIDRYDEEFIEAVATEPHYTANAIGSGGEVEFIFKGKKIGSGEIMLKHWRHWEGGSSIISRFRLRLNVQS
jgi:inhibitor of cysteine peptidase